MATWIGSTSSFEVAANWNPATVPSFGGELAEFIDNGASTSISITSEVGVDSFVFDASAPSYTITVSDRLQFQGGGIVNNSTVAQNLSITGMFSAIQFLGSSSAGNATFTVGTDAFLQFFSTSSGGTARFVGNGGFLALQTSDGALSIGSLEGSGAVVASTFQGGATSQILTVGSLGTDTTYSGILGDDVFAPAAFGLTKTGTGTLTLNGSAGVRYTLATTIEAGTLKAGAANVFSALSAYDLTGGTLDLNGFSQTIGSLNGGGVLKLGAGVLTFGDNGSTTGFVGLISGTGGLVKNGTAIFILSGTNTYSGDTVINAGMVYVGSEYALGNASQLKVNVAGVVNVQAYARVGSLADGASGGGGIMVQAALTIGSDNRSSSFSGAIVDLPSFQGNLIKIGTGTQILSGTNTYTGLTQINGGVLQIDGSVTSAVAVNTGSLSGKGTITGDVTVNSGGHVRPGASPGALATGNFTLNAGAVLDIEIAGTAPGTQYDQLIVTGTVGLAGQLVGDLLGSANPATGTHFTIIVNDGSDAVIGTFAGLSEGAAFILDGARYSITYRGGTGNDVVLTALSDPAKLALAPVLSTLREDASVASPRKVADLTITDVDGGTNKLTLSGADKALFEIRNGDLYLKAGAKLDFETNKVLDVTVSVDDATIGAGPEASKSYRLTLTDVVETLTGTSKANALTGSSGAEKINGLAGNDTIAGNGGNDTITGGAGADKMSGGTGADVFVFKPGDLPGVSTLDRFLAPVNGAYDLITDFQPNVDRIDLSALDANTRISGNQAFKFVGETGRASPTGSLTWELYGSASKPAAQYTIIKLYTDQAAGYDYRIVLKGHHDLDAHDFIL